MILEIDTICPYCEQERTVLVDIDDSDIEDVQNDHTLATCNYIQNFTAVTTKDNFIGVQFHPEKSGQVGSLLLQNFLDMVNSS